ncbi:UNVERIFIED_CONTAM: hypothetical protein HDU68_011033 [Siphonaria sp. JEL0065]|nr:hypothetical protein HDU68_011033 [Siphonaria sp. JEL0065]
MSSSAGSDLINHLVAFPPTPFSTVHTPAKPVAPSRTCFSRAVSNFASDSIMCCNKSFPFPLFVKHNAQFHLNAAPSPKMGGLDLISATVSDVLFSPSMSKMQKVSRFPDNLITSTTSIKKDDEKDSLADESSTLAMSIAFLLEEWESCESESEELVVAPPPVFSSVACRRRDSEIYFWTASPSALETSTLYASKRSPAGSVAVSESLPTPTSSTSIFAASAASAAPWNITPVPAPATVQLNFNTPSKDSVDFEAFLESALVRDAAALAAESSATTSYSTASLVFKDFDNTSTVTSTDVPSTPRKRSSAAPFTAGTPESVKKKRQMSAYKPSNKRIIAKDIKARVVTAAADALRVAKRMKGEVDGGLDGDDLIASSTSSISGGIGDGAAGVGVMDTAGLYGFESSCMDVATASGSSSLFTCGPSSTAAVTRSLSLTIGRHKSSINDASGGDLDDNGDGEYQPKRRNAKKETPKKDKKALQQQKQLELQQQQEQEQNESLVLINGNGKRAMSEVQATTGGSTTTASTAVKKTRNDTPSTDNVQNNIENEISQSIKTNNEPDYFMYDQYYPPHDNHYPSFTTQHAIYPSLLHLGGHSLGREQSPVAPFYPDTAATDHFPPSSRRTSFAASAGPSPIKPDATARYNFFARTISSASTVMDDDEGMAHLDSLLGLPVLEKRVDTAATTRDMSSSTAETTCTDEEMMNYVMSMMMDPLAVAACDAVAVVNEASAAAKGEPSSSGGGNTNMWTDLLEFDDVLGGGDEESSGDFISLTNAGSVDSIVLMESSVAGVEMGMEEIQRFVDGCDLSGILGNEWTGGAWDSEQNQKQIDAFLERSLGGGVSGAALFGGVEPPVPVVVAKEEDAIESEARDVVAEDEGVAAAEVGKSKFYCLVGGCNKSYTSKSGLRYHIKVHKRDASRLNRSSSRK